jgi:hypothetical protein
MQNQPNVRSALCTKKKKKSQQKVATYHQEVKDVAHGHSPKRTHIPTNKIGEIIHLKGIWQ